MNTKTKEAPKTEVPKEAPAAQLPAASSKREGWETFKTEIEARADEIASQLPPNLTRERFLGAALAAVKATPGILVATPRSLMSALTKAAQDGLLPDGREGIITVFSTTIDGQKQNIAQWNPMFYGIRKRARELDGIIIDAQVVFVGDEFEYELGDNPFIKHKPKPRTERLDASAGMAVYAIFRHPEQGILHREVMWKPDVFDTMNKSRAKDSLMWTTFWTEGWRKTAGRRGSKSVPVSPQLERLIQRDDDNFVFDKTPATPALPEPDEPALHNSDLPEGGKSEVEAVRKSDDEISGSLQSSGDLNDDDSGTGQSLNIAAFLARADEQMSMAGDLETLEEVFNDLDVQTALSGRDEALTAAFALKGEHTKRINEAIGQGDLLGGGA